MPQMPAPMNTNLASLITVSLPLLNRRGVVNIPGKFRGRCLHTGVRVDVLQQRIDGSAAARGKRPRPTVLTEPGSHIPFSLFSKVVDGFVDRRCAGAFRHGITRAE